MLTSRAVLTGVLALMLSACEATLTLPPYVPITTAEVRGHTEVADFRYEPRAGVATNEIRENAVGRIFVTQPISEYVTNAVRRELRQAGITLREGGRCRLDGTIHDFAVESLGFNATFISDITYRLSLTTTGLLLERRVQNSFTTSKFTAPAIILASFQKSVSDNVGRFLGDADVQRAIVDHCPVSPTTR